MGQKGHANAGLHQKGIFQMGQKILKLPANMKGNRSRIEALRRKADRLKRKQLAKVKVAVTFLKKHPEPGAALFSKEFYEMSPSEFKSMFAKDALRLINYESVGAASSFLIAEYQKIIIQALEERKDNVNVEGIGLIHFKKPEYLALVKRYCRIKKIDL